jgi:glutathione S-transferase
MHLWWEPVGETHLSVVGCAIVFLTIKTQLIPAPWHLINLVLYLDCKNDTTNPPTNDAGSYNVNLLVLLRPSLLSVSTVVCHSNLRNMYWLSVQQLVHHSVTGCPVRAGNLLVSGMILGTDLRSFGRMLELSWGGTRNMELDGGIRRRFLKDSNTVIMEGWCKGSKGVGRGPGRVGFGTCLAMILPAVPFPYDSRKGRAKEEQPPPQRYTQFRLCNAPLTSSCTWRACIALSAKGVPYKTIVANSPPNDDNGQTKETKTTNCMMRRTMSTLEFVNGKNGVVLIAWLNAIINFLELVFPNWGGWLLPLSPVAHARAREVAEAIDSVVQYSFKDANGADRKAGTMGLLLKCAIEEELSCLEALLAPYHAPPQASAVGGPFAIGTHGPNIADISLIPLLYNVRRYGINSSSYLMLTSIKMVWPILGFVASVQDEGSILSFGVLFFLNYIGILNE